MKNKLLTMMLIISTAFLANCAKSSDKSVAATATTLGSCAVGQVYTTQYNCIPQSQYCTQNFGPNYGQYNNQCVAGTTTTTSVGSCAAGQVYTTQYNCIPQSQYCTQNFGANYGQYNNQCIAGTATSTIGTSTCPAGQVGTAHGCLPQNTCPTGYGYEYGYYNNQLGGWCYPQTY
jgi:hypothetical protein